MFYLGHQEKLLNTTFYEYKSYDVVKGDELDGICIVIPQKHLSSSPTKAMCGLSLSVSYWCWPHHI